MKREDENAEVKERGISDTTWVKRHLVILLKRSPNWTCQICWSVNHEITAQFDLMQ